MLDSGRAHEKKRESAEIIQLPFWAEQKRVTPNSFLRSSLFAAVQGKDRRFLKEEILASQNGIMVKFTGEQLNQSDLDVWETLGEPMSDAKKCANPACSCIPSDGKKICSAHRESVKGTAEVMCECYAAV